MEKQGLKQGIILTLPVLAGYLFLGASYGMIMQSNGHSLIITQISSLLIFAGALQFAAIPMFLGAFHPFSAMLLALLVNVRHLFYGISMIPRYTYRHIGKFFQIYTMADEAFSIQSSLPEDTSNKTYLLIGVLCYSYWQIATFAGFLIGSALIKQIEGLDFVLTALFFVLFLQRWEHKSSRTYLSVGACATTFSLIFLPKSQFVLFAMILILIVIMLEYKSKENRR